MSLIKEMLDNVVHIGHRREYWSPKMRPYIYGIQNGIHVFDLAQTAERLEAAKAFLADMTAKGKTVLFVGTKLQAQDLVKNLATETGHFYITKKWVPGLLTNFATIKKRIAVYNKIEKDIATGELSIFTKKEQSEKMKELEKLRDAYEGLREIRRVPDVVFVVDGRYEQLALEEAQKLGIPSVALLGSTGDIDLTTYFVPCNVNTTKSIAFILSYLKSVIAAPKKDVPQLDRGVRRMESDPRRDSRPRGPRAPRPTSETNA